MRLFISILIICFFSLSCFAQVPTYIKSAPVDIKQEGVNKVLCMKNGNTLLFHFEPSSPVLVKVFDTSHKEIASKKISFRILDVFNMFGVIFKGMFEINGEAVMFLELEHQSKNIFLRLRFSGIDGTLIEENCVESSKTLAHVSRYVMHNREEENYAILFCTDLPQYLKCDVHVGYYNSKHEVVRNVPLEVERKSYDYINVLNAETSVNGISISLNLLKVSQNGTSGSGNSGSLGTTTIYDHSVELYYIPKDSNAPLSKTLNFSTDTYPFYAHYTYNTLSNALNILLLSYEEIMNRSGLDWQPSAWMKQIILKIDHNNLNHIISKGFSMAYANYYVKQRVDTNNNYVGLPIKMFTNEEGESSIISQSYSRRSESAGRIGNLFTYFGNIAITRLDGGNSENEAIVLPLNQVFNSRTSYYHAYSLGKKWQTQLLFNSMNEDSYNRQFVFANTYSYNKNIFIIFNDNRDNFNNTIKNPGDTVYNFTITDACFYKVGENNVVTKKRLFGEPVPNEFNSTFIEGADFDEKRGKYVSLVQCKRDKNISLYMTWCHLD